MAIFSNKNSESAIGVACILLGISIGVGALQISSEANYSGVGANFLPWVVGIALVVCGGMLVFEAVTTGYKNRDAPEGAAHGDWLPFVWVSAGIVLNALSITTIGFVLSCAMCFVLAVRGFHQSQGRLNLSLSAWLRDSAVGLAISAPVYWMFTKLLAINLPGLTSSGWI